MQSLREAGPKSSSTDMTATEEGIPARTPGSVRARRRRRPDPERFRERLLSIMDRKNHWAWPEISGPQIERTQLKIHFQQEYSTYVRDFPVLLARIHGMNPPPDVRRMLAENIYEEDTGGLSFGQSHPELFLRMMEGFGLARADFDGIKMLRATRTYRAWLDRVTTGSDWVLAAATMAIFVEGSINDRREVFETPRPKTRRQIEAAVRNHPLVRYHGVSPDCMDLTRAHQMVESGHRHDAYAMVVAGVRDSRHQEAVIACVERTLCLWLRYRDGVARACGLG